MGGTFDPIHNAHLLAASEAVYRLTLDKLLLIPNRNPVHKNSEGVASGEHRLAMVRTAIRSLPRATVSTLELDRTGPSYMVDTLRALAVRHPRAELLLVAGLDTIADLPNWHLPEEVVQLARLVGVSRPGYDGQDIVAAIHRPLPGARITLLPVPELDISSSEIRRRVRCGEPIDYLTPASVIRKIREFGLYRNESR